MLATDPLSLIFIGCAVFAAAFLLISTLTGIGHGHGLHFGASATHGVGGHMLHVTHAGTHLAHGGTHATHATHATHTTHAGHAATHATGDSGSALSSARSALATSLDQSLNLYGLLIFLLIFGLLGYLLHAAGTLPGVFALLLALLVAIACSVVTSALLARLFLLETPHVLSAESSQLAGRLGEVSMAIREGGVGEVLYTGETGTRHSAGARSSDGTPIDAGTEVVVVAYHDGIASVQPWDRFMAAARGGDAPRLTPTEREP
ncbi:MAG: NfeD family protein [Ktedonobacterales bacterium]|jgi:membrane protein implicated in regulation of membrane protease activity